MTRIQGRLLGLALVCVVFLGATSIAKAENWQGFYMGLHIGQAWSDATARDLDGYNGVVSPTGDFAYDVNNLFGGGQLGYNFQFSSNIVFGIEGELGVPPIDGGAQFPAYVGVRLPTDSLSTVDGNFYGTIAARLGFDVGGFLIYAKGGWGFVDVDVNFIDNDPTGITLVSGTKTGETLSGAVYGGGIEWAISHMLSLKVEYLHMDVSDTVTVNAIDSGGTARRFAHDIDDIDTVKVGINVRFHREPPAAPPLK